ncbi:MAG: hypothetical protein AAF761_08485, partial [Pseudomonadota bacterium]
GQFGCSANRKQGPHWQTAKVRLARRWALMRELCLTRYPTPARRDIAPLMHRRKAYFCEDFVGMKWRGICVLDGFAFEVFMGDQSFRTLRRQGPD